MRGAPGLDDRGGSAGEVGGLVGGHHVAVLPVRLHLVRIDPPPRVGGVPPGLEVRLGRVHVVGDGVGQCDEPRGVGEPRAGEEEAHLRAGGEVGTGRRPGRTRTGPGELEATARQRGPSASWLEDARGRGRGLASSAQRCRDGAPPPQDSGAESHHSHQHARARTHTPTSRSSSGQAQALASPGGSSGRTEWTRVA